MGNPRQARKPRALWLWLLVFLWFCAQASAETPPNIVTQPASRTNIMGTAATFAVGVLGSEPFRYQWFFNQTNRLPNATNAALVIPSVQPAHAGSYHVAISNVAGTASSAPASLVVRLPPRISKQPADVLTTPGHTVTFTVVATGDRPISYQWYHDLLLAVEGGTNATLILTNVQLADAGTYQVVLENEFGIFNSVEAKLDVELPPTIAEQPSPSSLVVTQGQNAAFSVSVLGTPPLRLQWFFNETNLVGQATNSTLLLFDVQRAQAGSYFVRASNRVGTLDSAPAQLQVRAGPRILQPPTNVTAIAGSTATFHVEADGDLPLSYQWFVDGTNPLANANSPTLTLANVQPSQAGFYSVQLSNATGRVVSPEATLLVLVPPALGQQPASLVVTQGSVAQFSVTATGSEPLGYQWYFNRTNAIAQANQPTLNLPSAQFFHAGDYRVQVVNSAGAITSAPATLTVRIPPAFLQQPANQVVAPGGGASFSVLALGDSPLTYQWYHNVTNAIPGATAATLTVTNVGSPSTGTYSVLVANEVGTLRSREATLVIKLPPTILQPPTSLIVTQGSPARFEVVPGGDGPFTYQWYFNETNPIQGAFGSVYTIPLTQPLHAGTYSVRVFNDAGNVQSPGAVLTVRVPPLVLQPPASATVPPGASVQFTVSAAGDTPISYQWFFNLTNLLVGQTNELLLLTNVQASSDGRYSVVLSNSVGTTFSPSAQLRIRLPPTLPQPPASLTATQGQSVIFTALPGGDPPFNYQWFFNSNAIPGARSATLNLTNVQATHAGSYSVRVTNLVGFVISGETLLSVRLYPAILEQPTSQTLLPGSTAVFKVNVTGDPPFTYQWFFNQNALAGQTADTLTLLNVQVQNSGDYAVRVVNPLGAVTSSNAELSVKKLPTILEQPASLVTTQGRPALFRVVAGSDGPFVYQWFFDLTNLLAGATNDVLPISNVQPGDAGAYSVLVRNPVGEVQSQNAELSVRLLPSLAETPFSQIATQGQTVTLRVVATSESPLRYEWRWHGTNLSEATSTTAVLTLTNVAPTRSGPYDVLVANDWGSVTSAVAILTVLGVDFGDAPEPPYPTLLRNGGARHVLWPGVVLGSGASAESDGQPNADATGDSATVTEEDGVLFTTVLYPGQIGRALVVASTNGLLNAWMDFDQANGWGQPGEQILTNYSVVTGTNTIQFGVPRNAVLGQTFARFRFSTLAGLSFNASASEPVPDGEVEDHAVALAPAADLVVVPSSVTQVSAGANATLTIAVSNLGPSTATGVLLTNLLSDRSTYVSATSTQGSCDHSNGIVSCALGSLASGERAVVTLTVRVAQGTNTTFCAAVANEFDPTPANNTSARAITGIIALPTLVNLDTIILPLFDDGPGSVYPSTVVVSGVTSAVFKITVGVHNINHDFPDDIDIMLVGPRGQKVLLMSDCGLNNALVDVSLTFDDDAGQSLPDSDPPILSGNYRPTNIGNQSDDFPAPAPPAPYTTNLSVFRGTDPNGVWSLYIWDDQAENATPQSDPGFIGDGWTLNITTADPIADLSITQSAQPDPVRVGSVLTYSVTVSNRGPAASTAVVLDTLPAAVTFVSANTSRGACTHENGLVRCDLGNLPSGAFGAMTIQVTPVFGGAATNRISVTGSQLDLNLANNTASLVTTLVPLADLELTMASGGPSALLGQPLGYTLTVTNHGPNAASSVTVTNLLPTGLTLLKAVASQGVCTNQAGALIGALGDLAPAAMATIEISATPSVPGLATNFASVAASELDLAPANNRATNTLLVLPAADLILVPLLTRDQIPLGQPFTTLLAVTNRGPSAAVVTLTDAVTPTVTPLFATSSRGTCTATPQGIRCELGSLNPGEVAFVTLNATPPAVGDYTNHAVLNSPLADPTPEDHEFNHRLLVSPAADLSLAVFTQPNPLWLGQTQSVLVTLTNFGPNQANAVVLTNQLAASANLLSFVPSQGACTRQGNELVCALGSLPPGRGATVNLLLHPTVTGPTPFTAMTSCELLDGVPSNNLVSGVTQVIEPSAVLAQTARIDIPRLGPANPYPSTIFVSGLTAAVYSVRVVVTNLTHTYPEDIDMLLVGPNGASVLLMSDAGADFPIQNTTLIFDDDGASLPDNAPLVSGLVQPTNYGPSADAFPSPAPAPPYGNSLAAFDGIDPNGAWSLFVVDDADKDFGSVSAGWGLIFSTLTPIADLVLHQEISANPAAVSSNVFLIYTLTNRGPAVATNVQLTNQLPASLESLRVTFSRGACTVLNDVLLCSPGDLEPGEGAVIVISGSPGRPATETNSVMVSSALLDLHPVDNGAVTPFVFENPPVITLQPLSQSITNGEDVQFHGAALGSEPLSYQWQRNGVDLPGATNPTLHLPQATPANSGTYRLRVANRVGVALSDLVTLTVFGPPTISDLPDLTIDEDTATGLLSFTVFDFESAAETIQVSGDSSNAGIVPVSNLLFGGSGSNRTLRVTPLPNATGTVRISVLARDTDNGTTTISFLLTVRPLNDLPSISTVPDQVIAENTPAVIPFTVADLETAPDALLYQLTSSNPALAGSNAVFSGQGPFRTLTLTPAAHQSGTAELRLSVTDADGGTVSASFRLTVNAANDPPTLNALPDLTIDEDAGPQLISLSGISSGAPNEAQVLSVAAVSAQPTLIPNPTVAYRSPAPDGTLTLAPLPDASGSTTITVSVRDGLATITRPFTVTVRPINDAPLLAHTPNQVIDEDRTLFLPLAVSDIETAASNLVVSASSSDPTLVPDANLVIGGSGANRTLQVTPASNRFGTATILVSVADTDGGIITDAFVLVVNPVDDPPTLDAIANRTVAEDAALQTVPLTGITAGGPDETQTLSVTGHSSAPNLIPDPTIVYTSPNPTGSLTFRPVANAAGVATLSVTVSDGLAETTRRFIVTVSGTNDAPVISGLGPAAGDEDATLTLPFNVSDAETPALLISLSALSSNAALLPTNNITFQGDGTNRSVMLTPQPNQSGNATISVLANDGDRTATNSFVVTINAVNDSPTLNALTNLNLLISPGLISVPLSGITSGAANESQTLSLSAANSNPALLLNGPSVNYPGSGTTGTLSFRPANNNIGTATITVTVDDGSPVNGTFSRSFVLNVRAAANTQPTISLIANQTTSEDTPTPAISFSVRDAETVASSLTLTATSSNPTLLPNSNIQLQGTLTNRSITLTPAENQTGVATVTLVATDTAFGSTNLSFNLTVTPVNDPPTISALGDVTTLEDTPAGPLSFTIGDVETSASSLLVTAVSSDTNLLANAGMALGGSGATRALLLFPAAEQSGTSTVTVRVSDGLATNSTSFVFTVLATNDPPSLPLLPDVETSEDITAGPFPFTIGDAETPEANLVLSVTSTNPALIDTAGIQFDGTGTNRTLSLTPVPDQSGTALLTVSLTDEDGVSTSRSFQFTVHPVNDPPTLNPLADLLITENSGVQTITLEGISSGAANEVQTLAVTASVDDANLIAGLAASYSSPATTGTLRFLPIPNAHGIARITVVVNDGQPINNLFSRDILVTIQPSSQPSEPVILAISRVANTVSVTVTTTAGRPYHLEYSDQLTGTNWSLAETKTGTGAPLTLTDSTATGPTRFYRVRGE